MGLLGILFAQRFAAHNVDALRNCLKMFWIDAASHPAKMIDLHSIWDGADEMLVCETVRHPCSILSPPTISRATLFKKVGEFPRGFFSVNNTLPFRCSYTIIANSDF